jgi:splicing factor 3A subunit 1
MAEADRVILPPPIVREIIDRTAGFIAKNGRSYEERIARSAPGTIKFAFLSETHPYHDYYEQTIVKLKAEGVIIPMLIPTTQQSPTKMMPIHLL